MRQVVGRRALAFAFLTLLVALVWWARDTGHPDDLRLPGATSTPSAATSSSSSVSSSGLTVDQLPVEARRTLRLIAAGGPFPYRQDGSVFGNRERLLPSHPTGYYREYTVPTPGSPDRGARRLITGDDGELYYTADHYRSFRPVEQDRGPG